METKSLDPVTIPKTDLKLSFNDSNLLLSFEVQERKVDSPLELILLIDVSPSMAKLLEPIKTNLFYLIDSLIQSQDRISIMLYGDNTEKIANFQRIFNDDKSKLKEKIQERLKAKGSKTSLFPAIKEAINSFKKSRADPKRRKDTVSSIFILSDGSFELNDKLLEILKAPYAQYPFSIYTFQYNMSDADALNQIASLKDGNFYSVDTVEEGNSCFASAIAAIRTVAAQDCSIEVGFTSKIKMTQTGSSKNWVNNKEGVWVTTIGQIQGCSKRNYIVGIVPNGSNLKATGKVKIGQAIAKENVEAIRANPDKDIRVQLCRYFAVNSLSNVKLLASKDKFKEATALLDRTLDSITSEFNDESDDLIKVLREQLEKTKNDMNERTYFHNLGYQRLTHLIFWLKFEKVHPYCNSSRELYGTPEEKMALKQAELQNENLWVPQHLPSKPSDLLKVVGGGEEEELPEELEPDIGDEGEGGIRFTNKSVQKKTIKTEARVRNKATAKEIMRKRGRKLAFNAVVQKELGGGEEEEPIRGPEEPTTIPEWRIDNRYRVLETAQWPNGAIGVVLSRIRGELFLGTGVLIGKNLVLTCAHNLYSREYQEECTFVKFIPAMNGDFAPFGKYDVFKWYFPKEYIEKPEKHIGDEDYALLILKKPIGNHLGHFGLSDMQDEERIRSTKMNLFGYPHDKIADKPAWYEQWGTEGHPCKVDEDYIYYQSIMTHAGQSGSPLYYKDAQDKCYASGIHELGGKERKATRMTKIRIQRLNGWIQEANKEIENYARTRELKKAAKAAAAEEQKTEMKSEPSPWKPGLSPAKKPYSFKEDMVTMQPKRLKAEDEFDLFPLSSSEEDDIDYEAPDLVKPSNPNDKLEEKEEEIVTVGDSTPTKVDSSPAKADSSPTKGRQTIKNLTQFRQYRDERLVTNEI